jgi:hypothetical protein
VEQKRRGWEMAARIEKTICAALHEAHKRQVEEVMNTLSEEPEVLQVSGFLSTATPFRRAKERV